MAYVPTKFHWDILKNEGILTNYYYYYYIENNNKLEALCHGAQ